MNKKHVEMYENVMGKKLSKDELIEIHKEATTPFEELDNQEWKTGLMIILFFAIICGIVIGLIVRLIY